MVRRELDDSAQFAASLSLRSKTSIVGSIRGPNDTSAYRCRGGTWCRCGCTWDSRDLGLRSTLSLLMTSPAMTHAAASSLLAITQNTSLTVTRLLLRHATAHNDLNEFPFVRVSCLTFYMIAHSSLSEVWLFLQSNNDVLKTCCSTKISASFF